MARITHLFRYPIKGLSAQPVSRVSLRQGGGFPGDRMFALARPDGLYSETRFVPLPKRQYFMLMKDERLAGLTTHLDVDTLDLTVRVRGNIVLEANLGTPAGILQLRRFYARVLDLPSDALPVFAQQPGYNFSDSAKASRQLMNSLSFINLASVRDLEQRIGRPVDPLRFRANVYLDGLEPWEERRWFGGEFSAGSVQFRGLEETTRCAATEVDPLTARRDIPLPRLLVEHYGDDVLGFFAEILADGELHIGDEVTVAAQPSVGDALRVGGAPRVGTAPRVGDALAEASDIPFPVVR
ncbi:hypothetical protein B0I08_10675 [Glaciihabitans tibetensis]|uniref:MOSC domain-containing protein n=1 Tax=Glaciihabitans tibetensis TaxID=1266600 RepID=A0A2T0VBL6_9MICO|nr:MOSC N-terminal beta barrel domain-containing protein [Glaciihabitans tibetensis]PRY67468.1 hypothetical protein B0I08_10675 [Glaciihabitans tibetensis]